MTTRPLVMLPECPRTRRLVGSVALVLLLSTSCASNNEAAHPGASATCEGRRSASMASLQRAIDANVACSVDADCTSVAFATACFDACTRGVASSGVAAVKAATDAANAGDCATYAHDCGAVVIPPCVPPGAPVCRAGRCE